VDRGRIVDNRNPKRKNRKSKSILMRPSLGLVTTT
jgi:hypothetical protein